ncbi:hypothetical protein V6N13_063675 [Hibiscus sabdariffa]|uniref:Transmembrane protein n=1 Tax=Hibiscus sabdariffa TaxID=183260 RepID=A0ABR2R1L3_9ROSI
MVGNEGVAVEEFGMVVNEGKGRVCKMNALGFRLLAWGRWLLVIELVGYSGGGLTTLVIVANGDGRLQMVVGDGGCEVLEMNDRWTRVQRWRR